MAKDQKPIRKQGRPALPADAKRNVAMNFRTTDRLRQMIDAASQADGKSVSDVINERLERSFDPDRDVDRCFSSQEVFVLARALGAVMERAGQWAYSMRRAHSSRSLDQEIVKPGDWQADAYAFSQAAVAAQRLLEGLRPHGEAVAPSHEKSEVAAFFKTIGAQTARMSLNEMALATETGARLRKGFHPAIAKKLDKIGEPQADDVTE